jgi:hypothetical protein
LAKVETYTNAASDVATAEYCGGFLEEWIVYKISSGFSAKVV